MATAVEDIKAPAGAGNGNSDKVISIGSDFALGSVTNRSVRSVYINGKDARSSGWRIPDKAMVRIVGDNLGCFDRVGFTFNGTFYTDSRRSRSNRGKFYMFEFQLPPTLENQAGNNARLELTFANSANKNSTRYLSNKFTFLRSDNTDDEKAKQAKTPKQLEEERLARELGQSNGIANMFISPALGVAGAVIQGATGPGQDKKQPTDKKTSPGGGSARGSKGRDEDFDLDDEDLQEPDDGEAPGSTLTENDQQAAELLGEYLDKNPETISDVKIRNEILGALGSGKSGQVDFSKLSTEARMVLSTSVMQAVDSQAGDEQTKLQHAYGQLMPRFFDIEEVAKEQSSAATAQDQQAAKLLGQYLQTNVDKDPVLSQHADIIKGEILPALAAGGFALLSPEARQILQTTVITQIEAQTGQGAAELQEAYRVLIPQFFNIEQEVPVSGETTSQAVGPGSTPTALAQDQQAAKLLGQYLQTNVDKDPVLSQHADIIKGEILPALAAGGFALLSPEARQILQTTVITQIEAQTGQGAAELQEAYRVLIPQFFNIEQEVKVQGGGGTQTEVKVSAVVTSQVTGQQQTKAGASGEVTVEGTLTAQEQSRQQSALPGKVSGQATITAEQSGQAGGTQTAKVTAEMRRNGQIVGEYLNDHQGQITGPRVNGAVRTEVLQTLADGKVIADNPEDGRAQASLQATLEILSQGQGGQPASVVRAASSLLAQMKRAVPSATAPTDTAPTEPEEAESAAAVPETPEPAALELSQETSTQSGQQPGPAAPPAAPPAPSPGPLPVQPSGTAPTVGPDNVAAPAAPGFPAEKTTPPPKAAQEIIQRLNKARRPMPRGVVVPPRQGAPHVTAEIAAKKDDDITLELTGERQKDGREPGKKGLPLVAKPGAKGPQDGQGGAQPESGEPGPDNAAAAKPPGTLADDRTGAGSPLAESPQAVAAPSPEAPQPAAAEAEAASAETEAADQEAVADADAEAADQAAANAPAPRQNPQAGKQRLIEEAVRQVNPAMNNGLTDAALWVWATAIPSVGLSVLLGAIVGDLLWLFKKKLIKSALNKVWLAKIIVGKEVEVDEIADQIKFSIGVKANIVAMNAVVAAAVLLIIFGVAVTIYVGCNTPIPYNKASGYRLTYIGAAYPEVCQALDAATNTAVGSGSGPSTSSPNASTPAAQSSTVQPRGGTGP